MNNDSRTFSTMQTGKPLKSYIKKTPSKVFVKVLNPFTSQPDGIILEGDPRKLEEGCIVDIWQDNEDIFFKKNNKILLETGVIIPFVRTEKIVVSEEEKLNSMSDEEMTRILNEPFLTLRSTANRMTSAIPLYRLLQLAKELEKSEKIIKFLEGRLADLELEKA